MSNLFPKPTYLSKYYRDFNSLDGKKKIKLTILEHSEVSCEIILDNLNYNLYKKSKLKAIAICVTIIILYLLLLPRTIYASLILAVLLLTLIYQLFNLVKIESLSFFGGLTLQIKTVYFWDSISILLVPVQNIFDIVINEVISGLKIKYILIARLQDDPDEDSLYTIKPILQLFPNLQSGVDCLEVIYRQLQPKVKKCQEECL